MIAAFYKLLVFRRWSFIKPLTVGKYGILIPDETEVAMEADIILTPLVGFDKHGTRLGRGGGYYDRTIALLRKTNPNCQIIGVAAKEQYIDILPKEPHDECLDSVVTELGIFPYKI